MRPDKFETIRCYGRAFGAVQCSFMLHRYDMITSCGFVVSNIVGSGVNFIEGSALGVEQ